MLLVSVASTRPGAAQLHVDASAQVGVMKRFLGSKPGVDDPGFGPTAQLTAHVALLPLVHVGGYFGHDLSPLDGEASRNLTFGGLRLKARIPWAPGSFRTWVFAGFGYAGVYAPSYGTTARVPDGLGGTTPTRARVEGSGGGFLEVPFGIGASSTLFTPWELGAELGARPGFGHSGSVYEPPGPQLTLQTGGGQNSVPAGLDRFALGLTVGVLVDL